MKKKKRRESGGKCRNKRLRGYAWHRVKALAASLKTLITKKLQNETSDSVN